MEQGLKYKLEWFIIVLSISLVFGVSGIFLGAVINTNQYAYSICLMVFSSLEGLSNYRKAFKGRDPMDLSYHLTKIKNLGVMGLVYLVSSILVYGLNYFRLIPYTKGNKELSSLISLGVFAVIVGFITWGYFKVKSSKRKS